MIVFDLQCDDGHRFEGWFGSSAEYERQHGAGQIACPQCGSAIVGKAVMAPAVGRKGNQPPMARPRLETPVTTPSVLTPPGTPPAATSTAVVPPAARPAPMAGPKLPPEAMRLMHAMATMQAKALESSRWVGDRFAEDARAIHYGEREAETIHGRATAAEAEQLIEEGIVVMPLPFPVAPPDQAN